MTHYRFPTLARTSVLRFVALASFAIGCDAADQPGLTGTGLYAVATELAVRQVPIDTSRFTQRFRLAGGGNVFITLTGEPSAEAITQLRAFGATPPAGRSQLVTFDNLKIATVWARLPAIDIIRVAQLPFVTRIESSDDLDFIASHSFSPSINSTASDIRWNLLRVRAPDLWRDFEAAGMKEIEPGQWDQIGVAILDTGGDCRLVTPSSNWEFLSALCGVNFTSDPDPVYLGQHGTDVGSFVASEPNNLWGAGVAPRLGVEFIKVIPSGDDWGPIVQGLNQVYALGHSVVNMSFGNCGAVPPSTVQAAISQFTFRVPNDAANPGVGVSLVASSGNGILGVTPCPPTVEVYPAAYNEVIGVAAIDSLNGTLTGLTVGPDIELSAPGLCVDGLLVGGGSNPCISGTSFAAPHVAGLIGVIRAHHPTWSAAYVRMRLRETATKIAGQALPRDDRFGYGIINAYSVMGTPSLSVFISGPKSVRPNQVCVWEAVASGGAPPLAYTWSPGGESTQSVSMSFSSSQALSVSVTDQGQTANANVNITVSAGAPLCAF